MSFSMSTFSFSRIFVNLFASSFFSLSLTISFPLGRLGTAVRPNARRTERFYFHAAGKVQVINIDRSGEGKAAPSGASLRRSLFLGLFAAVNESCAE